MGEDSKNNEGEVHTVSLCLCFVVLMCCLIYTMLFFFFCRYDPEMDGRIILAKVDCTEEIDLCRRFVCT